MNIPSTTQCFQLIKKMEMMDHIIDHSIMVSHVARLLCLRLEKASIKLNPDLIVSAALLHDITKTRSFKTKESHAETGGRLLTELGYPEVGSIIRQHVALDVYSSESPIAEQEIVNYADKRILHDKVVPLHERLEYIEVKYGASKEFKERLHTMWENTLMLEKKLFLDLDITPDQLSRWITREIKKEDYT